MIETDLLEQAPPISEIEYQFFWPPLPQADETDVADAAETRMSTGQSTPSQEAAQNGIDFETLVAQASKDLGITPDDYKKRLADKLFGTSATKVQNNEPADTPKPIVASTKTKRSDRNKKRSILRASERHATSSTIN
jgi:hypothetical protein